MTFSPRPLSCQALRAQDDAEVKLAEIDLHEELAELYEAEACPQLRRQFAELYRRLIGVYPEQRRELQEAMGQILAGGGASVDNVLALLRRRC